VVVTSQESDNCSRSDTTTSTNLTSISDQFASYYDGTMAPTTHNSTGKKSAAAAAAAALDEENAELKRKFRQMEEEKAASRPAMSPKSGPEYPKTNTMVGTKVMKKGEVSKAETSSITIAISFFVFCSTIFVLPAGGNIWYKVMQKIYIALDPKPSEYIDDIWHTFLKVFELDHCSC
jgi:hypothetical protein